MNVFDAAIFISYIFYDILKKLQELSIHICSITTDNLQTQFRGRKILQETIDNPFIKAVFRIPCYAHLINLVFKDRINSVLTIVKLICKPEAVDIIGRKCSTISPLL